MSNKWGMSVSAEQYDDDDRAVSDAAALLVFERLVGRAAEAGLLRGEELEEAVDAVEQLRSTVVQWHGEEVLELLRADPAGAG